MPNASGPRCELKFPTDSYPFFARLNAPCRGLVVLLGIIRVGLGLPISSKLVQNPTQTFLVHGVLDVDMFVGTAMCELGTPHKNVAILEKLGNHFEGLVSKRS